MKTEFIPFDEASTEQRRAAYNAFIEEAKALEDSGHYDLEPGGEEALELIKKPKPRRYIVEERVPQDGERIFMYADGMATYMDDVKILKAASITGKRAVIVEELDS